jgi:hypothetical protein
MSAVTFSKASIVNLTYQLAKTFHGYDCTVNSFENSVITIG